MRTSIRLRHLGVILSTMLVVALLPGQPAMPQNNDQAELLFQSAMNKELASGDLERGITFNPSNISVSCTSMQVRSGSSDSAKWLGDQIKDGFRWPAHSLIASESESPERKEVGS